MLHDRDEILKQLSLANLLTSKNTTGHPGNLLHSRKSKFLKDAKEQLPIQTHLQVLAENMGNGINYILKAVITNASHITLSNGWSMTINIAEDLSSDEVSSVDCKTAFSKTVKLSMLCQTAFQRLDIELDRGLLKRLPLSVNVVLTYTFSIEGTCGDYEAQTQTISAIVLEEEFDIVKLLLIEDLTSTSPAGDSHMKVSFSTTQCLAVMG